MNTTGKWLARAGSLLVIVGFLLPSLAGLCSALPETRQTCSLVQLSIQAKQPLLYLVYLIPIGALAVMVFTFLPTKRKEYFFLFLMGQLVGLGVGALSVLFLVALLVTAQYKFQPDGRIYTLIVQGFSYGFILLFLGYVLTTVGIFVQFFEGKAQIVRKTPSEIVPPPIPAARVPPLVDVPPAGPRLEVVMGSLSESLILIQQDDFSIGRSNENHLQIPDLRVSRVHVRLRHAQGAWFVQDQNSSGGTFVNGKRIQAIRLKAGDQIAIGGTTFVFRV